MINMTKLMKFSRDSSFLGRNGTYTSVGLELSLMNNPDSGFVMIEPTTSKKLTGRCNIIIPVENLQDTIDTLISLKKHYDRDMDTQ